MEHTSEKQKQYIENFTAENQDWIKKRPGIKVHYFDQMGRAEPIKQLLDYAGVYWEDIRCTEEEFSKMKKEGKLDFE